MGKTTGHKKVLECVCLEKAAPAQQPIEIIEGALTDVKGVFQDLSRRTVETRDLYVKYEELCKSKGLLPFIVVESRSGEGVFHTAMEHFNNHMHAEIERLQK